MTLLVKCKRCGKELRAKDRYAGMPTRCPRCKTINQLPSLSSDSSSSSSENDSSRGRSLGSHKPWQKPPAAESPTDICQICGKPIRGKAERFSDVHGVLYHLGCYQKHAGDIPEDVCRICKRGFASEKERVKDIVGFYYHRKCYQEELERQRLAASGAKPEASSTPPTKEAAQPTPNGDDDDWNLTPDPEEDWELVGNADDGWMRPDPDELELQEDPQPPAPSSPKLNLPAKPVEKPATNPLKRKPESKSRPSAGGTAAAAESPPARQATPPPRSAKPQASPGGSGSSRETEKKASASSSKASAPSKAGGPDPQRERAPQAKPARAKPKPLRRAKPIEELPRAPLPATPVGKPPEAAGLPEGLELLPEEADGFAEGLELLPESPQEAAVDGLEFLDAAPMVPATSVPAPTTNSSLDSLSGLGSLDGLEPLDGPSAPGGGAVQGVLVDPLTNQPMAMAPRRASSNSIPTWLWVIMGVGVGVVVIMLVASVVSVMWTGEKDKQPLASAESPEPPGVSAPPEASNQEDAFSSRDEFFPETDSSSSPSTSRLAKFRRMQEQMKGRGQAGWIGFAIGVTIVLAIYLGVSALALRLTCQMFGEGDATSGKIVGICASQIGAMILFSPVTATLESTTAFFIDLPAGCAITAMLIRSILPTSFGRALGIAICHAIMCVIVGVVLFVGIALLLLMWASALR